jgi:hypothetical protein
MAGTHDDAMVMLELAKWATMMGLYEGPGVFADDFDPETADASDEYVRKALIFNETMGTLVKNGLLNRELVLDWLYMPGIWERLRPVAIKAREESGVAGLYENFEALGTG